jgi:hypothetical protein
MSDSQEPNQTTTSSDSEAKKTLDKAMTPLDMACDFDSDAIFNYLTTLQGVITRLAANSGSCKTLCVTLASAIVVVITKQEKPEFAWVAFFPIATLGLLDAYYLGLERGFRKTYNTFTKKLVNTTATRGELFELMPTQPVWIQKGFDKIPSIATLGEEAYKKISFKKKLDYEFGRWLLTNIATFANTFTSCLSPAIWLFYGPLFAIVQLGKNLIFTNQ